MNGIWTVYCEDPGLHPRAGQRPKTNPWDHQCLHSNHSNQGYEGDNCFWFPMPEKIKDHNPCHNRHGTEIVK